jgi:hypothetical protein
MLDISKDEFFIEGAWMYRGEMPNEEVSHVRLNKVIKKVDRDDLARSLKQSYGVNRIHFRTIETDDGRD